MPLRLAVVANESNKIDSNPLACLFGKWRDQAMTSVQPSTADTNRILLETDLRSEFVPHSTVVLPVTCHR